MGGAGEYWTTWMRTGRRCPDDAGGGVRTRRVSRRLPAPLGAGQARVRHAARGHAWGLSVERQQCVPRARCSVTSRWVRCGLGSVILVGVACTAAAHEAFDVVITGECVVDGIGAPWMPPTSGSSAIALWKLYQNCFAFMYPSLFEGFGLPVLEAMSCGAAVITSTTTSLPEIGGTAGVLVDPTQEESITPPCAGLRATRLITGH